MLFDLAVAPLALVAINATVFYVVWRSSTYGN
jgi:hypothetical protein